MSINAKAAPVSFRNVTKVYGKDVVAVDDINLEIKKFDLVLLANKSNKKLKKSISFVELNEMDLLLAK